MLLACFSLSANADKLSAGFTERDAEVNGVRIHYSIDGKGSPVVLLHGYAQTSHMWSPIMPLLAKSHRSDGSEEHPHDGPVDGSLHHLAHD